MKRYDGCDDDDAIERRTVWKSTAVSHLFVEAESGASLRASDEK